MKKWKIIVAAILAALMLVAVPLAVLARNNEATAASNLREFKGGLAIVAPRTALVGNEMQLTVFLRVNQEPVSDVGIWLVAKDNVEALRNEVEALRGNSSVAEDAKDYEAVIRLHAAFLGLTDNKGRLTHTFDTAGNYALVAFKRGYWPDWSGIAVRELPRALQITAPGKAQPGNPVNIHVGVKGTNLPVDGAGIWAITAENIAAARAQFEEFRAANQADLLNADWESQLSLIATFLGRTDERGKLTATFEEEGRYLLVAFKRGYIPAFSGIAIFEPEPARASSAPLDIGEKN